MSFRFDQKSYYLVFFLVVVSGLNIDVVHKAQVFGLISPIRMCWALLMFCFVMSIRHDQLRLEIPVLLLSAWAALHIVNLLFFDGSVDLILTRLMQALFIGSLFLSVLYRHFSVAEFCRAASPFLALLAGVSFCALLIITHFFDRVVFDAFKYAVIGNPANFSIFCAQFIALFLVKDLFTRDASETKPFRSVFYLIILIAPILAWQLASSGRAGLILTLCAIAGYGLARYRFVGAVMAVVSTLFASAVFVLLTSLMMEFFGLSSYIAEHTGRHAMRGLDVISSLDLRNSAHPEILDALNRISSERISILFETVNSLKVEKVLTGFGVGNFRVTEHHHFPHIELLRYFSELGVIATIVAAAIYLYPFQRTPRSEPIVFSKMYMVGFMVTCLLQPSGPLTHLNNSILFWLLFSHVSLVKKLASENKTMTSV